MAEFCNQPYEKIDSDTDRDYFMTAAEAKTYGIIDDVIQTSVPVPDVVRPDSL
jgi:ATP-dependent Clp protease, protease subunit